MAIPIPIIGSLIDGVVGIFKGRQDRKLEETKGKIERLQKSDDAITEWEKIQAESGKHSWKDEYWTVILSLPCVLVFFPDMVPHIRAGFDVLESMPEFYQYWLGVAILTSFGVRIVRR